MTRRSKYALGVLAGLLVVLLLLQTPLMRTVRDKAWQAWATTLARWLAIGPLTVTNNVADQLSVCRAENVRFKAESGYYRVIRQQMNAPAYDDLKQSAA